MSRYLNTKGHSTLGIALCARCSRKFPVGELMKDPTTQLMVCRDDLDVLDPYLLPPRETEDISLPYVRPDEELSA